MLEETSQDFRTFFLLALTKEMIMNSAPAEVWELKETLDEERKEKLLPPQTFKRSVMHQPQRLILPRKIRTRPLLNMPPSQPLPPRLQYIKPVPTTKSPEMNIEKLDALLKDPSVHSIECNGPGTEIIVRTPASRKTKIILNKEEIIKILNKFSMEARIPLEEGVFKVVIGNLMILAVVSAIVGSKFIIKKMRYNPQLRR